MSAQEFGEWQAWIINEQQHPAAQRVRHAQLLATTMNGALTRKSGGLFDVRDLMGADPWAPPQPMPGLNPQTLDAQVASINAEFRSEERRVGKECRL